MNLEKLKKNLDNEIGDYYKNIVLYIEALIEAGEKDEAFSLLKEELNQPYVPEDTLKKLEEIFDTHYVADAINKQITLEEAREGLKNLDIEHIVANFFTINLRLLHDEILEYLSKSNDYLSISILIYTLIDQNIVMEFEVTKFGLTSVFDTQKLKIVDEELLTKYNDLFSMKFIKEPSFIKYCNEILKYYLLVSFPFKLDNDFDLYDEVVNYVLRATGQKIDVNNDFLHIIEYDNN